MSKKNKKQFDGRRFFTEEDLEGLQMNDDGVLEVGFGNPEEEKPVVSKKKGKQSTVVKRSSDLDKKVAAILKKLDIETPKVDTEDEDENLAPMDGCEFDQLMANLHQQMEKKLEEVTSVKESERLKKEFHINDELSELRKLADQTYSGICLDWQHIGFKIKEKKSELKKAEGFEAKRVISKEIEKLQKNKKRLEQIMDAGNAITMYENFERQVEETKKGSLTDDIKQLYNKYGDEAIRKLIEGYDGDLEEAI
jgi:hypothetical protein